MITSLQPIIHCYDSWDLFEWLWYHDNVVPEIERERFEFLASYSDL